MTSDTILSRLVTRMKQWDPLRVILYGNCLVLAISPFGGAGYLWLHLAFLLCFVVMLIFPRVLQSSLLWILIFLSMGTVLICEYEFADNHKYLMTYWTLCCSLALLSRDPLRSLQNGATLLVGCAFTFATLWKIGAGQYLDGGFFAFVYLYDSRFSGLIELTTTISPEVLQEQRSVLHEFVLQPAPASAALPLEILQDRSLYYLTLFSSYWTICIEALVAFCFLTPLSFTRKTRDIALIAFLLTTYSIAPIERFGMILALMGYAQSFQHFPRRAVVYLVLLVGVQFSGIMLSFYTVLARAF